MENTPIPKTLQRLLIVFGVLLVVSLLASGFSAVYVTLAAPQRSIYVPTTIGFEGQLADAQGAPVADGEYTITFTLYDNDEGGTDKWHQTKQVQVNDGLYSVQLGSSPDTFDADDFNGPRWLAVKVGNDAEMTPRIQVGAVPFALNAKYAAGLQDNPVADTAPQTDNALMWNGSAWAPQGMTFPDLAPVGSNASPNALLQNYRTGAILTWTDANTVTVSAGELMINGYMRRNTDPVAVTFAEHTPNPPGPTSLGLVGSPQSTTVYNVYAVASDNQSTFDLRIAAEGTTPSDVNCRKIGSFKTVSDSPTIAEGSAANFIETPQHTPGASVYRSTDLNLALKTWAPLPFDSERWDNDNMHDPNGSRITARTAGKYLIIGQARFDLSETGTPYLKIKVNGTIDLGYAGTSSVQSAIYHLEVGDYVELWTFAAVSSGTAKVIRVDNYAPTLMMVKLSD